LFFKNNGSCRWGLSFFPYVWVLIELEAPDVDTEMKTELLVDSGVWVLGEDRDELIFGLQRARLSEPHQWLGAWTFVWGSGVVGVGAVLGEQR
jgi:hypothetical protein